MAEGDQFYAVAVKDYRRNNPYDIYVNVPGPYSLTINNPTNSILYIYDNNSNILITRVMSKQTVCVHANTPKIRLVSSAMEIYKYVNKGSFNIPADIRFLPISMVNDNYAYITISSTLLPTIKTSVPDIELVQFDTVELPLAASSYVLLGIPISNQAAGNAGNSSRPFQNPNVWNEFFQYPIPPGLRFARLMLQNEQTGGGVTPSVIEISSLYIKNLDQAKLSFPTPQDSETISGNMIGSIYGFVQNNINFSWGALGSIGHTVGVRSRVIKSTASLVLGPQDYDLTPYSADFFALSMTGGDLVVGITLVTRFDAEFWPYD